MATTSLAQQTRASLGTRYNARRTNENELIGLNSGMNSFGSPSTMPRKMQSTRLSDIRWDDLASKREQRRVLNLRGLPSKLCTAEALHTWLRAQGLGHVVEDLKVLPGKAGRLGCAVVRVREVADVERFAKLLHGRQCGAGSPIAVSFAAPGGLRGLALPRAMPAKVQSSLGAAEGLASPRLISCSSNLVQPVPDLALLSVDLSIVKDSQPSSETNIYRVDTASSLADERLSVHSRCASSASLSSADSNYGEDCIFEAGQLRPPPGLEGFCWQ